MVYNKESSSSLIHTVADMINVWRYACHRLYVISSEMLVLFIIGFSGWTRLVTCILFG